MNQDQDQGQGYGLRYGLWYGLGHGLGLGYGLEYGLGQGLGYGLWYGLGLGSHSPQSHPPYSRPPYAHSPQSHSPFSHSPQSHPQQSKYAIQITLCNIPMTPCNDSRIVGRSGHLGVVDSWAQFLRILIGWLANILSVTSKDVGALVPTLRQQIHENTSKFLKNILGLKYPGILVTMQ